MSILKTSFLSILLFLASFFNINLNTAHDSTQAAPPVHGSQDAVEAQAVEEAPIFGPVTVLRAEGKPIEVTYSFSKLPGFEAPFSLVVVNGDSDGYKRISSASFRLNGKVVLSSSNFNQKVGTITKTVELIENNTLTVKLQSKPGSFLKVSVIGQKIEQPEQVLDLSSVTVGPGGGSGTLENFATVTLGEVPLRPSLTLKLEKIISPAKLELYASETPDAGPALLKELLRITSSENITNSIAVAIQIPPALVSNLPQGHQLELFAEFTQSGSDGEVMSRFERLGASYDSIRGIAYANISPYAFTPSNSVTANIIIGSYKDAPTSQVTGDNIVPAQAVNANSNDVVPLSADLTFSIPPPISNPLHTALFPPTRNMDFGPRISSDGQPSFHRGVDLNPSPDAPNVPVYSILAGTVTAPGPGVGTGESGIRIWIDHGNGLKSFYCHLSKYLVSEGTVDTNKQIGISGNTGCDPCGDHLHLEYHINGKPVDPMLFINGNQDQYLNDLSVVALVNGNAIEATRQQVSGAQVTGSSAFLQYQSQLDLLPLQLHGGSTNQLSIVVQCGANGASSQITTVPLTINAFPLRVTLRWDKYDTDVDLHVMDSLGNESWYRNLCGLPNGCLDRDDVDGFGPEVFDLTKLAPGVSYTVFLHYYSDHGNGSTTATVVVEQGEQTFGPFSYTLSNNQFATVGVYPQ